MMEHARCGTRFRYLILAACFAAGLMALPAAATDENVRHPGEPVRHPGEVSAPAGEIDPRTGETISRAGETIIVPVPSPDLPGSPFLLEQTTVHTVITGPVAHVVVTQKWTNPNPVPVDGLYIFPLPDSSAVNDMILRIGERLIQGQMHRREEARAIYEQARREGRVAGLLDQERPNVFVQRVANIMPGADIDVILALDHAIECESGECEYVFPTVVGPRFVPARQIDPGLINPPVIEEGRSTGQTLSLTVELHAGIPISDLQSSSHRVLLTREDDTRARVTLAEGETSRLNRDFRLRWRVGSDQPELGLLAWREPADGNEPGVFTLILQPPAELAAGDAASRELVFVLDCSGSMRGVPLEAAKKVVRQALAAVRPQDTFQIIRFSENASGLGPDPLTPTAENLRRALAYLDSLQGQGGTEMIAGIRAALGRPADPDRLRIVAFLTDGYIGNEREILGEVRRTIGDARLFSFGIGSSVNRYLLEGLAEEGRGVAAFLGPRETPDELVERFVRRIDTPVLTDIRIRWEDLEVSDLEPAKIPDLFAGQSLLIHGRYRRAQTGVILVEGRRRGRHEILRQVAVLPEREEDHEALGRLWARARIHRLERQLHDGPREDVREAIIQLGLRHRLMTHWTSLVAVDSAVVNTTGPAPEIAVPVEMPEDVSYEGVFGKKYRRGGPAAGQTSFATGSLRELDYVLSAETKLEDTDRAALAVPLRRAAPSPPPAAPPLPQPLAADEAERESGKIDGRDRLSFHRILLVRTDGTRIVVESDGEVWKEEGRTRTLVDSLDARELEKLRERLASVAAASWPGAVPELLGSPSGTPRLEIEGSWGKAMIRLPTGNRAVAELVHLLESWTS
jgi:Ca-activated chloride channel family protein